MPPEMGTIRWGWLRTRLEQDPAWIERSGGWLVALVLLGTMVGLALGWLTLFGGLVAVAGALVLLGLVNLSDFAVRERSRLDPRLATLLLLTGIGAWLVLAARLLWG